MWAQILLDCGSGRLSLRAATTNRLSEIIIGINKDRERQASSTQTFIGRLLPGEFFLIKPIVPILIKEGEFDLVLSIKHQEPLDYELLSDNDYKVLQADYHGDDPEWNMYIAEWLVKKNLMKSAYVRAVHAALKDHRYAGRVRGLLAHYGCMTEDKIWVELSSDQSSRLTPKGAGKYTEIPITAEFQEQLPELRKKLRFGEPPDLLPSCPINLYE